MTRRDQGVGGIGPAVKSALGNLSGAGFSTSHHKNLVDKEETGE